jgi:hypothetical protein
VAINGVIAVALLASTPHHVQQSIEVDVIELNHVIRHESTHFVQVIIWQWAHDYRRHDIVDWWMVEDVARYPRRAGDWYWVEGGGANPVRYRSRVLRVTWTEEDPEWENRKVKGERWRK